MKNYFIYIIVIIIFCFYIFKHPRHESFDPSTPYDPSLDKSLDAHTYHDKSAKKNAQINDLVGNWFCSSIGPDGENSKCAQFYIPALTKVGKSLKDPIFEIKVNSATGVLTLHDYANGKNYPVDINEDGTSFELETDDTSGYGNTCTRFTSNTIVWKNGWIFKKNYSDGSDVCGANQQYNNVVLSECESDAKYISNQIQQQGGLANNLMLDGYPNTQDFVFNMGSNKLTQDIVPQPQCLCSDELRCLYLPACNDTFIDNCNQVKRRKFVLKKVCKVNDFVTSAIQKVKPHPCSGSDLILQTPKIKGNWQGWFYLPSTKLGHIQAIYTKHGAQIYDKEQEEKNCGPKNKNCYKDKNYILCNPNNKSQTSKQNLSYPVKNLKLPNVELSPCVDNMHIS